MKNKLFAVDKSQLPSQDKGGRAASLSSFTGLLSYSYTELSLYHTLPGQGRASPVLSDNEGHCLGKLRST